MKKLVLVIGLFIVMMSVLTTLGSAEIIKECMTYGGIRLVSDANECTPSETFVTWDTEGDMA